MNFVGRLLFVLSIAGGLPAQVWDRKPPAEWSASDVYSILTDSPWVSYCLASRGIGTLEWVETYYRIRLLTASPVREALLLIPVTGEMTVDVADLRDRDSTIAPGQQGTRVERSPLLRPAAAAEFIILTITETRRTVRVRPRFDDPIETWPPDNENVRPAALMSLQFSDLVKDTFLSTPQARRIPLVRYEPPAKDSLGAKFFFPRRDSRGSPSVDPATPEVRFTASIAGRKITATFKPDRMVRNGRLEM